MAERDAVDILLIGLATSEHMGDVVNEVRHFLSTTERPCPKHIEGDYSWGECWICGVEGDYDEELGRFIPTE